MKQTWNIVILTVITLMTLICVYSQVTVQREELTESTETSQEVPLKDPIDDALDSSESFTGYLETLDRLKVTDPTVRSIDYYMSKRTSENEQSDTSKELQNEPTK